MPINYPKNRDEVVTRVKTDIKANLPGSDPFLQNNAISATAVGYGMMGYDIYTTLQQLEAQMFPDTATDDFALRWGNYKNVIPLPATQSIGNISATGIAGTVIPKDSELQNEAGLKFKVTEDATVATTNLSINSLTRVSNTAIATFTTEHKLATTNTVTISGADQSAYNITTQILVIDAFSFSYTITGTPATPATGTPIATVTHASVPITSINFGVATNLANGASLTFNDFISGLNSTAYVDANGLVDGADAETEEKYKERYLYAYRHPISPFNVADITDAAKSISSVSRVWVYEITPGIGQVTTYFTVVTPNSYNVIPNATQVATVKSKILERKTACTDPNDVFVYAPTPINVFFQFDLNALQPNTITMKQAIRNSLIQSLAQYANVGVTFPSVAYESAIWQTIDPANGDRVQSFTLLSPTSDIVVTAGQIAVYNGDNLL